MFSANSSQVSDDKLFVEDVFSTYLYTGNDATNNITNGIDLTGKGGMVWLKSRSNGSYSHFLFDTARGAGYALQTSSTNGNLNYTTYQSFGSNGFSLFQGTAFNTSPETYASWTFRETPKFFDVVTYTGNGVSGRQIAHNLGVAPGCIIIKCYSRSGDYWLVYHRGLTSASYSIRLESTAAQTNNPTAWASTAPTATAFTVGDNADVNSSGATYVAYLFAHDTTSDGIIQCGSFDVNGSGLATVNLGWEPQWVMVKNVETTSPWAMFDNMRGMPAPSSTSLVYDVNRLSANTSAAESTGNGDFVARPLATGFEFRAEGYTASNVNGFIYIAIRRGPMRTPTSGTSVFAPVTYTGNQTARTITSGFPIDLHISSVTNQSSERVFVNRLAGVRNLTSTSTAAEGGTYSNYLGYDNNTGVNYKDATSWTYYNENNQPYASWFFRRAPSFFDVVCYAGVNATLTLNHNLGVAPELIIVKNRTSAGTAWPSWASPFSGTNDSLYLNTTAAKSATGLFTTTPPTSTTFTAGNDSWINASGSNYVAYLFASCPGVSKVFSFTGNGSSQTINCGFSGGARFVMIKRTDSTGDWWVWDTARGIVSANDPALRLNSTAAETTGIDSIDPDSSGFIVNQDATTNINVNGASYIGLAVA